MSPFQLRPALLGAFAASAFVLGGCHRQTPLSELEKTAAAMANAQASAPPSNAAAEPAGPAPAEQLQAALSDYKAGKMEDAVTRLQLLRSVPTLTAEQRMALQDSVAAVMAEVYTLAEKGDPRAVAAVARYEQMQTSRR
jgi:hypothetical protein